MTEYFCLDVLWWYRGIC